MDRPAGIAAIAGAFYLVAGYLCVVGVIEFAAPGTISPSMRAPFMYGRELAGPESAILVGAGWALVGFGLMRMENWARWAAVVLLALGIVEGIPAVSAASVDPGWRLAWYGGQMMVKIVGVWFLLLAPDAREAFRGRIH